MNLNHVIVSECAAQGSCGLKHEKRESQLTQSQAYLVFSFRCLIVCLGMRCIQSLQNYTRLVDRARLSLDSFPDSCGLSLSFPSILSAMRLDENLCVSAELLHLQAVVLLQMCENGNHEKAAFPKEQTEPERLSELDLQDESNPFPTCSERSHLSRKLEASSASTYLLLLLSSCFDFVVGISV